MTSKFMKTNLIITLVAFPLLMTGCSASTDSQGRVEVKLPSGATSSTTETSPSNPSSPTKAGGGVDVGNLTTYLVPLTEVAMTADSEWSRVEAKEKLVLRTSDQSEIRGQLEVFKELVAPNIESLEKYVQQKSKGRKVSRLVLNGSPAVEVAAIDSEGFQKQEIYLLNDSGHVIRIESDLKEKSLKSGTEVIKSTRILYRGEAVKSSGLKTIQLEGRNYENQSNNPKYAYIFSEDCYGWADKNCGRGVAVGFNAYSPGKLELRVGLGGGDTGRIIKIGTAESLPFDSIKTDGKYLVANGENIALADIYTLFTPQSLQINQSRIDVEEGAIYLLRTISWPNEDLITKIQINRVTGTGLELTYEKLTQIPQTELKKMVDAANDYTRKYEMPKSEGEVLLFNREIYDSYSHASFNFHYSTSGNTDITRNSWQLRYGFECGNKVPTLASSSSGSGISRIYEPSKSSLAEVSVADMPNANQSDRICGLPVKAGGIYLIDTYDYGDTGSHIAGAVQVLEIEPEGKWVRLKFRRLVSEAAKDFVEWQKLAVDPAVIQTKLEIDGSLKGRYSIFTRTRGDVRSYYYEDIDFVSYDEQVSLQIDTRPYPAERGFIKIDSRFFEKLDLSQAEQIIRKSKPVANPRIAKGDVYLINLKTFHTHIIAVMRIDEVQGEKEIAISVKDLFKAKAPYNSDLP